MLVRVDKEADAIYLELSNEPNSGRASGQYRDPAGLPEKPRRRSKAYQRRSMTHDDGTPQCLIPVYYVKIIYQNF